MAEERKKKGKWDSKHERGVVYFSHIPHGFYEKPMREFLSQFGTVTNLKIGRSSRTGRCRGYAFVEFLYQDVAKIVAETMNNYLMFEKLVKCELVPTAKVSRAIFRKKINPARPPLLVNRFKAKQMANSKRSEKQTERRAKRQSKNLTKIQSKLQKYGIELVLPAIQVPETTTTPKTNQDKKLIKTKKSNTPVMELDSDDDEISLKTPPHVKKIKSRSNSAANTPRGGLGSKTNTPIGSAKTGTGTPKLGKALTEKLMKKKSTPNRPLMKTQKAK